MLLVCIEEKDIPTIFNISGPVRFLFEHGKRAVVSENEIAALQQYVSGMYAAPKKLYAGDHVLVPTFQQKAEVICVEGKKCIARLQQLGATVSFQLT